MVIIFTILGREATALPCLLQMTPQPVLLYVHTFPKQGLFVEQPIVDLKKPCVV